MANLTTILFLAACAACGADAPGPQPDTLVITDDPELEALVTELLPDLARRSGLELREPVRVARRSREELVRYLTVKLDEELPEGEIEAVSESYRLLGLLPEGLDLRGLLLDVYTEQVAGFYEPDSAALFVMEDQPAEALRPVLVHELVHAVQDQAADLDSLTDRSRGNDRQMAAQAAIEGHATLVMLEYLIEQSQGRPVDLAEVPDFAAQIRPALEAMRGQYPALAAAPVVIQEDLLFPYLEGAGFVQRVWAEEGRAGPFGAWLPESTEQVLEPDAFLPPDRDDPVGVELSVPGVTPRYANGLGAMETGVLLEELAGDGSAEVARGWEGDRYLLLPGDDGATLVWLTLWEDPEVRDRFVELLGREPSGFPRPATLEPLEVDGLPAALLRVGTDRPVEASVSARADGSGGTL